LIQLRKQKELIMKFLLLESIRYSPYLSIANSWKRSFCIINEI